MEQPNILFILADDLGWGDVSYHGAEIRTPNIDRLTQIGVELDQHYVCPVCTPTRVGLMTGRHPGRFGRHATVPSNNPVLPDGYCTLAGMLRDAGYDTGLFGKWHLGSAPSFFPGVYGFEYSYGSLAGGVDPYTHRYKRGPYSHTWHRNGELISERGHATDLITDEAIGWIEERQKPWFCYVPFTAVHTPIRAPEAWIDRYSDRTYDVDPVRNKSFKVYAAYASHMDYCVGRLIETLKCLDQSENTIVIFTSDNGAVTTNPSHDTALYPGRHDDMPRTGSNYPLRGHKAQLYEGGIRTPAAISWLGRLQPSKLQQPVHIVDWMPTFAALLNCRPAVDPQWDGMNILPLISGEAQQPPERVLYWNLTHNRFALRHGKWKLICRERDENKETELFNIGADPLEERNVAARYPDVVERLLELICEQRKLDDTSKREDVE
ncbi:MAG: sulfatase-like hydrolase/transferase [Candidatus Latescibacteria bacterium]|nr:sulfatase-like hydrolase/transferase [Candidatus Latescibacterota bacterium]